MNTHRPWWNIASWPLLVIGLVFALLAMYIIPPPQNTFFAKTALFFFVCFLGYIGDWFQTSQGRPNQVSDELRPWAWLRRCIITLCATIIFAFGIL